LTRFLPQISLRNLRKLDCYANRYPLPRLEGAVAISRFLARFPNYSLNGAPVRGGRVRFRGFLSVPCEVR